MMRAALVATGLAATLLLACAAPARPSPHQDHLMTAAAQDQALLPGARDAAQRVLTFLSNAKSTADFTVANIGQQLGITLGPDPDNGAGWSIYHSPDLGQGWTYGAQFAEAQPPLKPTFRFWFFHAAPAVSATPVCALPLDQLRTSLTTHGWVERTVPSEIGSVLAIEFAKHELLLTLTPRDIAFSGDAKCVLSLQASGGH
jgi:hypothetical protein